MTGAQKCVVWMSGGRVSTAAAALLYCCGVLRASRGERRGSGCCCGSYGGAEGCTSGSEGGSGEVVGTVVGVVLARVCLMCTRGATRAMCGAVGFVDVCGCKGVIIGSGSPFEVGHGSESSSYGPVFGAPFFVSEWSASIIARKRWRRLCLGSCSIPRNSSHMTW